MSVQLPWPIGDAILPEVMFDPVVPVRPQIEGHPPIDQAPVGEAADQTSGVNLPGAPDDAAPGVVAPPLATAPAARINYADMSIDELHAELRTHHSRVGAAAFSLASACLARHNAFGDLPPSIGDELHGFEHALNTQQALVRAIDTRNDSEARL